MQDTGPRIRLVVDNDRPKSAPMNALALNTGRAVVEYNHGLAKLFRSFEEQNSKQAGQ